MINGENMIRQLTISMLVWVAATFVNVDGLFAFEDPAVLEAFSNHVESLKDVDSKVKQEVAATIADYGVDAASDAITESLILLHQGYGEAVEKSDTEDTAVSQQALGAFVESSDKFLAADASFYLARALMNNEQFEAAKPLLAKVGKELAEYNVHVGNAQFYAGVAQAGLLEYEDAIKTLKDFLQFYPDAPERLRVAAWRRVQQLGEIEAGKMADVYQRMDYSRRKLSQIEPGEQTQDEQEKIVNMLAKLIKEQEKKEASSSSSKNDNTQQQKQQKPEQQQQQQSQSQSKQQKGKSQKGGTSNNPNGKVVKKTYDNGPASPWSRLRDRSRDPANAALKDKLPPRHRDIVERYYEAANGQGEGAKSNK